MMYTSSMEVHVQPHEESYASCFGSVGTHLLDHALVSSVDPYTGSGKPREENGGADRCSHRR